MNEVLLRRTLGHVQDLIAAETGAPLKGAAARRLERILRTAIPAPDADLAQRFETREVTVLLADLRGFTALSAHHSAELVLSLLNRYLVRMSEIVVRHRGTIDKFMGDAIMVLFGAPSANPDDVLRAVTCAVEMQLAMDELNAYHRRQGVPEIYMGIGLNTGPVMAGLLGSELYSEYTVIGEHVNLAARIESFSLRGQVLISEATWQRCAEQVRTGAPSVVLVKGQPQPVRLREVLGIPAQGLEVPRRDQRRGPRVPVELPARYRTVTGKRLETAEHPATIVEIGYGGVLLETPEPLAAHAEIALEFDLPVSGGTRHAAYAKVRRSSQHFGHHLAGLQFTSLEPHTELALREQVHLQLQRRERRLGPALRLPAAPLKAESGAASTDLGAS